MIFACCFQRSGKKQRNVACAKCALGAGIDRLDACPCNSYLTSSQSAFHLRLQYHHHHMVACFLHFLVKLADFDPDRISNFSP